MKPLADLDWCDCRWPTNDAAPGEPHLFCAEPAMPGRPYCAAHYRLAYTQRPPLPFRLLRRASAS